MGFFSKRPEAMTSSEMVRIIGEHCENLKRNGNVVEFEFEGIGLALVYDENANRMRVISPICDQRECAPDAVEKAMEANFHVALDARYALSRGVVWSAFIHPLSSLDEELLVSAIQQVATANTTFGDDYSSGQWAFNG